MTYYEYAYVVQYFSKSAFVAKLWHLQAAAQVLIVFFFVLQYASTLTSKYLFACLSLMILVTCVTDLLQTENSESRNLCLQNLRPGQFPFGVQTFNCLCVCSLSKLILCCIGKNFSRPIKKIKIVFPPSKIFSFYVKWLMFFLPKSKVANRGSTNSVMFPILHAGDSLPGRTTRSQVS